MVIVRTTRKVPYETFVLLKTRERGNRRSSAEDQVLQYLYLCYQWMDLQRSRQVLEFKVTVESPIEAEIMRWLGREDRARSLIPDAANVSQDCRTRWRCPKVHYKHL